MVVMPKKKRNQEVFIIKEWFDVLLKDHIDLYKPKDKSGALFVNRDGKAMTEKSYDQYFRKVKNYFIRLLMEYGSIEDKILAKHLKSKKWLTDIGREIFSNMVAEKSDNPAMIATARGDKDFTSSLFYLGK